MKIKEYKYYSYEIINEEGILVAKSKVKKDSDISSILELLDELDYKIKIREE